MYRITFATLAAVLLTAVVSSAQPTPTLTIVNRAPDDATVKVVGPTSGFVQLKVGSQQTVDIAGGMYVLRIRYCNVERCRYTQSDSFVVTSTPYMVSRTTITLHSAGGNLNEKAIAPTDF